MRTEKLIEETCARFALLCLVVSILAFLDQDFLGSSIIAGTGVLSLKLGERT